MTQLACILAATDLSAPARHAVDRAGRVAGETGARLELAHVVSQSALDGLRQLLGLEAATVETHLLDQARAGLEGLAAELKQNRALDAGLHLSTGTALRGLLDEADRLAADLIVLGARGEGYLGRLLLGTTSERLLRRTRRPMLVVKQTPHEAYRRVLVPVDFSPWSARCLALARAVAPSAELVLLHAYEVPFEDKLRFAGVDETVISRYQLDARQQALAALEDLAEGASLDRARVALSCRHGAAAPRILEEEQDRDCDLIVMGKHGQGMLEELLLGSVTKHVLAESTGDVLVIGLEGGSLG